MKKLEYYECLPDAMEASDVEKEIRVLLLDTISSNAIEKLSAFFELSIRQVDSGSKVSKDIVPQLNNSLISLWDRGSIESTEMCVGAIINFELREAFELLKKESKYVSNKEVKQELEEAFVELGSWGAK